MKGKIDMESKGHMNLLCDIGEMFALLAGESDTENILQRCVLLVAKHLKAEVCSIYLLETEDEGCGDELLLQATTGLNPDSVGVVRMKVGEGLVGKSMEDKKMILEDHASLNPDFKYFPSADEDEFECFLAIPILRAQQGIGVLVVQRRAESKFSTDEAMVLRSIASQLAVLIENARVLLSLQSDLISERGDAGEADLRRRTYVRSKNRGIEGNKEHQGRESGKREAKSPCMFSAKIASRGVAVGRAVVAARNPLLEILRGSRPFSDDLSLGLDALERAVEQTLDQIERMEKEVARRLPEAATLIFDAHVMILKDKGFSERMKELTRQGDSALKSVISVSRKYMKLFGSSPNEYLREKVADVEDIAIRLIDNLLKKDGEGNICHEDKILIARDLLPSEAVRFAMKGVAGIVLIGGGIASHAAILARSLAIPMVITETLEPLFVPDGSLMVIDGEVGHIYLNPGEEIEAQFQEQLMAGRSPDQVPEKETLTKDGTTVNLMVNINLLSELDSAVRLNAQGVGLYRSEFPFLVRNDFPSDMEQFKVYDMLFSKMAGKEVTVRTLDVGGDKMLGYFHNAGEANPELGLRSIRFGLRYPRIMENQLRAILAAYSMAEPGTTLRIKFPMVSSLDEFRKAKAMVLEAINEVSAFMEKTGITPKGGTISFSREIEEQGEKGKINGAGKTGEAGEKVEDKGKKPFPKIGMMLELPSVVEIIDDLATEVDFFSIGTNDFVQYMLAADRTNDRVADYYAPHHPAVLRGLNRMSQAAVKAGKDISVCGEMAKEPSFIPFFLGIGIRKLSVNQQFLFSVQQCIDGWSLGDAESYAKSLLAQSSVEGVANLLEPS